MPRIKDGFKGERAIVLPAFLIEELKQDPLGSELYITDIGYYPHAYFHYRKRDTEEVTEFILIYMEQKLHFSVPVLTVRKASLHKRIHESKKD